MYKTEAYLICFEIVECGYSGQIPSSLRIYYKKAVQFPAAYHLEMFFKILYEHSVLYHVVL